jgi:iron complex outermembrane receptor protein
MGGSGLHRVSRRRVAGLVVAIALWMGSAALADELTLQAPPPAPSTAANTDEFKGMSLEDLMSIEVTSVSKTRQRVAEAAAAVTVITQEDIQRSGLHEIPEILRLSPELFVQHSDTMIGWTVASRGFAQNFQNKLLVLQDGRSLYTPHFSGVYWNAVDYPIPDLDRIEVVRGPGGTLWGANAVNGVINIITKPADQTQGGLIDSRLGSDTSDLAVRYGGKIDDKTYYRVYGKGRAFDDMPALDDERLMTQQWQDSRTGFRIDRYPDSQNTLTLQGDGFYQVLSSNGVSDVPGEPYSHDYHSGVNVLGRWTHVTSDKSDYSLQAYYDNVNFQDSFVDYHQHAFDVEWQQRFEIFRNNELIYGLGARARSDYWHSPTLPAPLADPSSRDVYLFSAFVQDTITLVPKRWQLILGSKFEWNSFTDYEIQPTIRTTWTPNETNTLWGAVSRAVRTPSRWEWDDHTVIVGPFGPGGALAEDLRVGNHDLNSESLIAYEAGYRHQFNSALSVDLSVFANIYDDLTSIVSLPPTTENGMTVFNSQWDNSQKAETFGGAIAANWQVTREWRLSGSYSHLTMFVHNKQDNQFVSYTTESASPTDLFQVHSYLSLPKHFQFNTSLYYASQISAPGLLNPAFVGSAGSYMRLDANIAWKPNDHFEIAVGIQNALDPVHPEATGDLNGSAEVQRAIYGQLTWRF